MCRRDHGLTWREFQDLTLCQLEALEERRMIEIRHARFNAALITSTLYNAHRSQDSEALEVWDFIPGFDRDEDEIEADKMRRSIKHAISVAFAEMDTATAEEVQAEKVRMIARMKANGVDDPEQLIREVYPDL